MLWSWRLDIAKSLVQHGRASMLTSSLFAPTGSKIVDTSDKFEYTVPTSLFASCLGSLRGNQERSKASKAPSQKCVEPPLQSPGAFAGGGGGFFYASAASVAVS